MKLSDLRKWSNFGGNGTSGADTGPVSSFFWWFSQGGRMGNIADTRAPELGPGYPPPSGQKWSNFGGNGTSGAHTGPVSSFFWWFSQGGGMGNIVDTRAPMLGPGWPP